MIRCAFTGAPLDIPMENLDHHIFIKTAMILDWCEFVQGT